MKTAFPDGTPPEPTPEGRTRRSPPTAKPRGGRIAESNEPINVIVVADADLLEDRFWAQVQNFFGQRIAMPIANNGDFVINALDNLSAATTSSACAAAASRRGRSSWWRRSSARPRHASAQGEGAERSCATPSRS